MNELALYEHKPPMTASDVRAHVNLIQEIMQAVMKKDTHYGVIPGVKKPSLWKPGAEVLAVTFRIAMSYRIQDLSTSDEIRYRVTAIGTHQTSNVVMGEGVGECSSGEEKYKWRAAVCQEEFEDTPENRRRYKYSKWEGKVQRKQQVRTEPADIANTILKMACKRGQVAMTLNAVAASDIFTQDIEDLPEHLRNDIDTLGPTHSIQQPQTKNAKQVPYPQDQFEKNASSVTQNCGMPSGDAKCSKAAGNPITAGALRILTAKLIGAGYVTKDGDADPSALCVQFRLESPDQITLDRVNEVYDWLAQNPKK